MDAGHCRLNLAVLYSHDHAKRFLGLYEAASGRTVMPGLGRPRTTSVYLPGWGRFLQIQAGRRLDVDFAGMHERVERTLMDALRRA